MKFFKINSVKFITKYTKQLSETMITNEIEEKLKK